MKRLCLPPYLILAAFFLLFLCSCSKDEDEPKNELNVLTFDGTPYTMVDGIVEDYGHGFLFDNGSSPHYNFDFSVFDGEVTLIENGYTSIGVSLEVYIELFAPGESFTAGTFSFVNEDTATESDVVGKYIFADASVTVVPDSGSDVDYEAVGGSVTVSGSGTTDYTIEFDLQLEGGTSLTGTYSGDFQYSDERE